MVVVLVAVVAEIPLQEEFLIERQLLMKKAWAVIHKVLLILKT